VSLSTADSSSSAAPDRRCSYSWTAVLLPTVAVSVWVALAAGRWSLLATLAALVFFAWAEFVGSLIVMLFLGPDDENKQDGILAFVIGLFALQSVAALCLIVLRLNALVTSISLIGLAALAAVAYGRRRGFRWTVPSPESVAMLVIVSVFVGIWSLQNLKGITLLPDLAISPPWLDVSPHSMWIGHFAHQSGVRLVQTPYLAGVPLPPYHYGGYMLASLMAGVSGLSAYTAAVSIFPTTALLLTGMVAYVFGRSFSGPRAGLLAAMFAVVVPDPSFYVLENRWVSYFFFQQIAGSGAFATALMGLAWIFCLKGARENRRKTVLFGVFLAACVFFFKSQIFLVYTVALVGFAALTWPRAGMLQRGSYFLVVVLAFFGATSLLSYVPLAPTLELAKSGLGLNLKMMVAHLPAVFRAWVYSTGPVYWDALWFVVPFVSFAVFGLWFLGLGLLAASLRVRRSLPRVLWWFPWIILINFLIVACGLKENNSYGDPFEVLHKTFVWPYLALAAWVGLAAAVWLRVRFWKRGWLFLGLTCVCAALAIVPVLKCARTLQSGFVYPGSSGDLNVAIPRGEYETATYLSQHTLPDSVVQIFDPDSRLVFAGLSERHTYLAERRVNALTRPEVDARVKALAQLLNSPSAEALKQTGRSLGIKYLVLPKDKNPPWRDLLMPLLDRHGYRIYRL
jgi:hypothetical protein